MLVWLDVLCAGHRGSHFRCGLWHGSGLAATLAAAADADRPDGRRGDTAGGGAGAQPVRDGARVMRPARLIAYM